MRRKHGASRSEIGRLQATSRHARNGVPRDKVKILPPGAASHRVSGQNPESPPGLASDCPTAPRLSTSCQHKSRSAPKENPGRKRAFPRNSGFRTPEGRFGSRPENIFPRKQGDFGHPVSARGGRATTRPAGAARAPDQSFGSPDSSLWRVSTVDWSTIPSTRSGRKCRWKAVTANRVNPSK